MGGLDPRRSGPGEDNTKEVQTLDPNKGERSGPLDPRQKGGLSQKWVKDEQRRGRPTELQNSTANKEFLIVV